MQFDPTRTAPQIALGTGENSGRGEDGEFVARFNIHAYQSLTHWAEWIDEWYVQAEAVGVC